MYHMSSSRRLLSEGCSPAAAGNVQVSGPQASARMMLTHLPAGLLVLHAYAPDPTAGFSALFQAAELPPLMKQGVMDPLILKHYLLLHDDQGQPNGLSR